VHDEVWALLEQVLSRTEPAGILLERDDAFESAADDLAADLGRARTLVSAARRGRK
jgi:uncharacterized protein (UPF0276 family)